MSADNITEADIEYLRNIDTRPGPNAGQKIDPTKPGPAAPPSADVEGMREALAAFIEWADSPLPADCPYCHEPESWEPTTEHFPECPFVKARTALALPDSRPGKQGGA